MREKWLSPGLNGCVLTQYLKGAEEELQTVGQALPHMGPLLTKGRSSVKQWLALIG